MKRFRPLRIRTRLAVWYVIFILPMLLVYSAVMGGFMHHQVLSELDTRLKLDLAEVVDRHLLQWNSLPPSTSVDWLEGSDSRLALIDSWRINPAKTLSLRQRVRGAAIETVPPPDIDRPDGIPFNNGDWRMVQGHASLGATRLLIRVALPRQPLEQTMHMVWVGSGLGMLVILSIAGGGGLWIAGAALQPITQLVLRTRRIGPGTMAERLPVTSPADELSELSAVINGLLGRVESTLDRQGRFATEAAHELRTPLTAQRNVGELALREAETVGQLRHAVASMLEEGHHMQKVIDGLLTLARADTGKLVMQLHSVDLCKLLELTVPTMLPLAEERMQSLSWHCSESVHVYVDEALFRQVLLNLIHNSIIHTAVGTRIEVRVSCNHDEAILSIVDNGQGMEVGEPHGVFLCKGIDRSEVRGLGLGLSIARALTRAQGAKMQVESAPGIGTSVHIRLSLAPAL